MFDTLEIFTNEKLGIHFLTKFCSLLPKDYPYPHYGANENKFIKKLLV